jgi:hypothetical protein
LCKKENKTYQNEFDNQQMKQQQKMGFIKHLLEKMQAFKKKPIQNESLSQTQCLC